MNVYRGYRIEVEDEDGRYRVAIHPTRPVYRYLGDIGFSSTDPELSIGRSEAPHRSGPRYMSPDPASLDIMVNEERSREYSRTPSLRSCRVADDPESSSRPGSPRRLLRSPRSQATRQRE